MLITILTIAGFQGYWLKETYHKEKRILEQRTHFTFRETVRRLQAKKLKLDNFFDDSSGAAGFGMAEMRPFPGPPGGEEMAGLLNDVTIRISDSLSGPERAAESGRRIASILKGNAERMNDSVIFKKEHRKNMVVTLDNSDVMFQTDSAREYKFERVKGPQGELFRFLYNVDSLQDSLRLAEVDSAFQAALVKEKINISYSISRTDSVPRRRTGPEEKLEPNKVIVGFARPVAYTLHIGNAMGYLARKLASPFLFSLVLVGVTILSFVLLYRNLQRQRRLTEIKNEFISNITHELKTPIATVGVAIEALRNFNAINDPLRTKEYLDISQNELHRLSLLVDKVLKLSMFENKEIELKYESLDLAEIVNEVVSSMKLQIEKNRADVSLSTDGHTTLEGDGLHLLSVVFNLLDNTLKYRNGNIAVKIEIKEKENDVVLSVADNGIGIPQEYKDRVFEKFFRVPTGDKHNAKGYGLGLSYVAHVVEKHKGKIEVESQPGIGTKFIITLPKAPSP
jgi:two-component system phosphate regulon sensor histidine kinase PhoR